MIIKEVIAKSFVEYSLNRFRKNLKKIRNNIFKSIIIRYVFEQSDMCLIDADACIKLLKKYNFESKTKKLVLSLLRQHQMNELTEMNILDRRLVLKIAKHTQWSDSTNDQHFIELMKKLSKVIFKALVDKTKLKMLRQRRMKKLHDKKYARKRLRAQSDNLRLIKKNAKLTIIAKLQKEKKTEIKRVDAQFMKFWRMKRNDVHVKKVTARKAEKVRIKQMKEMTKSHTFIFVELLQLIIDLETEWKTTNSTWLTQKEVKKFKKKNYVWRRTMTTTTRRWKLSSIHRNSHERTMILFHLKMMMMIMRDIRKMRSMRSMRDMRIMTSQNMTLILNFCSKIFLITCMMSRHFKHIWSFIRWFT